MLSKPEIVSCLVLLALSTTKAQSSHSKHPFTKNQSVRNSTKFLLDQQVLLKNTQKVLGDKPRGGPSAFGGREEVSGGEELESVP